MTRKQRLLRMILSKRLKKYGRETPGTLRKPIKFAGLRALLQAQSRRRSQKDGAGPLLDDAQTSDGNG